MTNWPGIAYTYPRIDHIQRGGGGEDELMCTQQSDKVMLSENHLIPCTAAFMEWFLENRLQW